VPEVKKKITKQELFNIMKTFYTGRMYMSKKEMEEMLSKYDLSDVMDLVTDARSYYVGRAYMSKKELTDLGSKYGVV
jgi:predicted nucleotidyltransferase